MSEAIIALAVAKIVDECHLAYSTRIADHLFQDIVESICDDEARNIFHILTVSHLLSQTSTLSQHAAPWIQQGQRALRNDGSDTRK